MSNKQQEQEISTCGAVCQSWPAGVPRRQSTRYRGSSRSQAAPPPPALGPPWPPSPPRPPAPPWAPPPCSPLFPSLRRPVDCPSCLCNGAGPYLPVTTWPCLPWWDVAVICNMNTLVGLSLVIVHWCSDGHIHRHVTTLAIFFSCPEQL